MVAKKDYFAMEQDKEKAKKQPILFYLFNTSKSFIEDICYTHLNEKRKCQCNNKKTLGRVKELKEFYEGVSENTILANSNIFYKLKPSVIERIKLYENITKNN